MIRAIRRLLSIGALALGSLALVSQAGTTDIYYHNDLAGTPMAATDGAGNLLWRQSYKPYGERLDPKAPADQLPWYTGKAHVEAAGLSYFGARWYDPALGRFMGVDPVGFSEANVHSFNRYAYANNNPYKFVDPDGRAAETVFDLISFGISVEMFRREPTLGNFLGAAVDGLAVAVPFVPGGVGAIRSVGKAAEAASDVETAAKGLEKAAHGNKIDSRPATLYEKYDKDGNFLKHGITKHEDPAKRYTAKEIDGGTVVRTDCGPRCEMIKKERDLVERRPGPDNREPWAGKRLGE
ncbi:MAG: RHS domain-containing protein [Betaproteobacteria bacterium]|nr:RHS domain-containing protein [Betaproteobacteria bacterium]